MLPWALNRMIGTKFKVVTGYESETTEWLAIQRNEANGIGSGALSDIPGRDWLGKGLVKIIYSNSSKRDAAAPEAPTLIELAENEQDRESMVLLSSSSVIGETLVAPPGTPSDRAAILSHAFEKMMIDPDFRADAKQSQVLLDFLTGEKLQAIAANDSRMPSSVVERVRQLTAPQH
jgi:tripartite-type tricarboxylate transporter receptor subunit TctC